MRAVDGDECRMAIGWLIAAINFSISSGSIFCVYPTALDCYQSWKKIPLAVSMFARCKAARRCEGCVKVVMACSVAVRGLGFNFFFLSAEISAYRRRLLLLVDHGWMHSSCLLPGGVALGWYSIYVPCNLGICAIARSRNPEIMQAISGLRNTFA